MALIKDILAHDGLRPFAREQRARPGLARGSRRPASASSSKDGSRRRTTCSTCSTRRPGSASPARPRARPPTSTPPSSAARKALPKWAALPGHERARFLYALARHVQKRERFLAVLETIDNGKPIRESRDIDVPLARPPLLPPRRLGLADRQRVAGHAPGRRLRADHPVELPAPDARLEDRPGARGRVHGRAEARRAYAADRARLRRDLRRGGPARRRRQHRHRRRRDRRRARRARGNRQDRLHWLDRGRARRSARRPPERGKKLTLELGGKSPFLVFDDADLDSAVEGVVDAIWFNQGQVCCAGSRLLAAEGIADALHAKLRARMAKLRVGDPLDKSTDVGAIVSPVQLERIERLMRAGAAEGLEVWRADDAVPDPRLLLSADPGDGRRAGLGPHARGDLRAGPRHHDFPHPGRGGRARQQHPLRPRRLGLDRERQPGARGRGADQGRRRLDQFDQPVRRGLRLRRLSRERLWPRGRPGGALRVPRRRRAERQALSGEGAGAERACREPLPAADSRGIDRTAKLYVGGKQARPDSGASYAVLDPKGREIGLAGSGAARTSATPSRRRPRRRPGARRPRTTGRRCSITSPRTSPPAPTSSPAG